MKSTLKTIPLELRLSRKDHYPQLRVNVPTGAVALFESSSSMTIICVGNSFFKLGDHRTGDFNTDFWKWLNDDATVTLTNGE